MIKIRLFLLLLILLVFCSCEENAKSEIIGIWDYSRPIKEQLKIEFDDDTENQLKYSKASKIWTKYEDEGFEHFYLEFEEQGKLVEYKAGMAFKFDYKISNDTIFKDNEPFYRIVQLTRDSLTLKYLYSDKPTIYSKVEIDLSSHELMN
ncbi:hypothetical protein FGM00_12785 [Aggregatimonas sangjinii]|uniref:Lipocalin-like domain-containing protein n=1 Tax=Aggregatimonas sangjinii TaxID=2583587 RepID=A0A5B7SUV8_9FLAO|nr:hypothetical protein [Aggregatimonas sangjinii]QCX00943.1 hypothetical protein FGM00_12785 [Aggregatimonas sangjinii]